ncbi:hypothetical protein [Trinickia mobilis]|nr:hypothetical protein [Trinickia mobilis]
MIELDTASEAGVAPITLKRAPVDAFLEKRAPRWSTNPEDSR